MIKSDKLFISVYNDYYGKLLTQQQCQMIKLYYDCDMSLAEIATEYGVSRQAVRDSIVRAENLLTEMEQKLGFVEKMNKLKNIVSSTASSDELVEELKKELEA